MSNICRLCLETNMKNYYSMETSDYRHKMRSVLPEINIDTVEDPLICLQCSELLLSAYYFKSNCLQTNEELETYATDAGKPINLEKFLRMKNQAELINIKVEPDEKCVPTLELDEDYSDNQEAPLPEFVASDFEQKTNEEVSLQTEEVITEKDINQKVPENSTSITQKPKFVIHKCMCNKIFTCKRNLEAHMKRFKHKVPNNDVTGLKRNTIGDKCTLCKRVFLNKKALENHILRHDLYTCSICKRITSSKVALEEHMRTHTGERPFQCSYCGKAFAQAGTLGTHIKSVHSSERPHVCSTCGQNFSVRGNLTKHMKSLHGNLKKNFICSYCGKGFSINSKLEQHLKWHTGVRNFYCQVCNKSFVDKGCLTKHMRIHNGEKPFQCPICPKTFTQNYNMKVHYKSCSRRNAQNTDSK